MILWRGDGEDLGLERANSSSLCPDSEAWQPNSMQVSTPSVRFRYAVLSSASLYSLYTAEVISCIQNPTDNIKSDGCMIHRDVTPPLQYPEPITRICFRGVCTIIAPLTPPQRREENVEQRMPAIRSTMIQQQRKKDLIRRKSSSSPSPPAHEGKGISVSESLEVNWHK